jgi:N-acetyl-beta-hexosaminidase
MKEKSLSNFTELEGYFIYQTQQIAAKYNRTIINWQEIFSAGIKITPKGENIRNKKN